MSGGSFLAFKMAGIPRRQYSDREKAEALAALDACGGNYDRAAAQTGIPKSNLVYWAKGRGVHPEAAGELREEAREALDMRLEQLAHRIMDKVLEQEAGCKIDNANFSQLLTGFGIAIDKMRLLREQSTSITQNLSDDERRTRISNLINTGATRSGVVAPDAERTPGTGPTPLN